MHLKIAYELGVRLALEEAGLVKNAGIATELSKKIPTLHEVAAKQQLKRLIKGPPAMVPKAQLSLGAGIRSPFGGGPFGKMP